MEEIPEVVVAAKGVVSSEVGVVEDTLVRVDDNSGMTCEGEVFKAVA